MLESDFQTSVRDLCRWMGLTVYHTHNSERSDPGFPDLVIAGSRAVIFRELKKEDGRVTPDQAYWIQVLRAAGHDADVWRPSDFPARVTAELGRLGRVTIPKPPRRPKKLRGKSRF